MPYFEDALTAAEQMRDAETVMAYFNIGDAQWNDMDCAGQRAFYRCMLAEQQRDELLEALNFLLADAYQALETGNAYQLKEVNLVKARAALTRATKTA